MCGVLLGNFCIIRIDLRFVIFALLLVVSDPLIEILYLFIVFYNLFAVLSLLLIFGQFFLFAFVIGLVLGYSMFFLEKYLYRLYGILQLETNSDRGLKSFVVAGVLGTMLHVLLDAPLYGDIRPLYPIPWHWLHPSPL